MRAFAFLCLLALAAAPAMAQWRQPDPWAGAPPQTSAAPAFSAPRFDVAPPPAASPLPPGRLEYSIPLAGAFGFAGGAAGLAAGYMLLGCSDEGETCDVGPNHGEFLTAALGLAVGSTVGAHLGGLRGESRGAWAPTFAAAAAGSVPLLLFGPEENNAALMAIATAPLAAALTDHLVRRPRRR